MREKQLPTPTEAVDEFVNRHLILKTDLVHRDRSAIYWTTVANVLLHSGYHCLPPETLTSEPTIGLLLNMLDRSFEHVEGAIVAYDTGSMAASEVVARAAVESSINVMYILAGDKVGRLAAYFRSYFDNVNAQVRKWLDATLHMSGIEAQAHREAAHRRQKAIKRLKEFADYAISQMPSPIKNGEFSNWPNIFTRFDELGLETDYRTVYARMSSQTHMDAEDTLNYFWAIYSGDAQVVESVGLETVNFSRLLVYFGVLYFIKASIKYAEAFGLTDAARKLGRGNAVIDRKMQEIALEVGAF